MEAPPRPDSPAPTPPRASRLVLGVVSVVLILTVLAMTTDRRRPGIGRLLIQSDSNDAHVVVRQKGRRLFAPTNRRSFQLPAGSYDLSLDNPPAFDMNVHPTRIEIVPEKTSIANVEWKSARGKGR